MKLYFSPGACSFAPHIMLNEIGAAHTLDRVNTKTKQTASGEDFLVVNPKGYVPVVKLDNGEVLTEGVMILQYLADLYPEKELAPKLGTMERYRLMEMMNYLTTELHKGFSPLFAADKMVPNKEGSVELRDYTKAQLSIRIGFLADILKKQPYLMGAKFTIADIYATTILRWAAYVHFDLSPWPVIQDYLKRMQDRPSVQAAIKAEGLKA